MSPHVSTNAHSKSPFAPKLLQKLSDVPKQSDMPRSPFAPKIEMPASPTPTLLSAQVEASRARNLSNSKSKSGLSPEIYLLLASTVLMCVLLL